MNTTNSTDPKISCDASTQVEVDDVFDEEIPVVAAQMARLWRQKSIERTKQRNNKLSPTIFESIDSSEEQKNKLKVVDGCWMGSKDKNFERQVPFWRFIGTLGFYGMACVREVILNEES